jgi:lactate racemase
LVISARNERFDPFRKDSMTDVSVPWSDRPLQFSLPADWELLQVAESDLRPAGTDWPDRMALAINQPGTGLPLSRLLAARRGGRVAIIVEDLTRHSPLHEILPLVLREARHARVEDSQIEIVFATGMHPPLTPKQAREKLGPSCDGLTWRCNPWNDRRAYVNVGKTAGFTAAMDRGVATADVRILISSVSPHLQAGFGGGYKMFLPGCASVETIRALHRLGINGKVQQLVGADGQKNPMRQAIDNAGQLLEQNGSRTFAVQYLLDHQNLPSAIATGEPLPAQRMLAKQAAVNCGVIVPSQADVLISNAYPRDYDLWQSFKGIANTIWAVRPGGVMVCLTRCAGGLNGVKPVPWPLSQIWTRRLLSALGPQNLSSLVMRVFPRLAGDAAFFVRLATGMLHRNPIFIVSPELVNQGVSFPGLRLFADMPQALTACQELLGGGRQRVIVFPTGGITYPAIKTNGNQ